MPPRLFFPLTSGSLALVSLLLISCALGYLSPSYALPSERRQRLSEAAGRYAQFLRFGNVEMAAAFVEPAERPQFFKRFGPIESSAFRFTQIEVENIEFTDLGRAVVLVEARMYRLPSVRELQLVEQQRWRYDPTSRAWYVTPDFTLYETPGSPPVQPRPEAFRAIP